VKKYLSIILSIILLIAFTGIFSYFEFQTDILIDSDSPYHMRMAEHIKTDPLIKDFSWGEFTILKDNFSDKEYFFHVLLVPFTLASDIFFSGKIAGIFSASAVILVLLIILHSSGVRFPFLFLILLLTSGGFLVRLDPLRPHLFSIILSLLYIHALLRTRLKTIFLISFLYPLSYTAFHLIIIYLSIFIFSCLIFRKKIEIRLIALSLAGLCGGIIVHPHFPNNLEHFYMVNFYLMWQNLKGVSLGFGGELLPAKTLDFLKDNFLVMISLFMILILYASRKERKLTPDSFFLLVLTLSFLLLSFVGFRYVEYFVPFCVLFCAVAATEIFPENEPFFSGRFPLIFFPVLIAVLMIMSLFFSFRRVSEDIVSEGRWNAQFYPSSRWIDRNIPKNELIFTCSWDDTIPLLRHAYQYHYLWLLDPVYSYAKDSRTFSLFHQLKIGHLPHAVPSDLIKNIFLMLITVSAARTLRN
jgi:hypothetical protein